MPPLRLIATVCTAQVLAEIGAYTLPALLPTLILTWSLSYAEAGWITSMYYAGYMLSSPVLISLTDRVEPRRVYCWGMALLTCSHLGFALMADGFWGAIVCRTLAGIGWAGAYMPGLKVLSDRLEGRMQSRGVSWHAAGIGVSGALSFVVAGSVTAWCHWRWAFGVGAMGPLMVGWILDLAGGQSVFGWGVAFAHVAVVMMVGPLALLRFRPQALAGDGA